LAAGEFFEKEECKNSLFKINVAPCSSFAAAHDGKKNYHVDEESINLLLY
jgi:hypothetical protein